MRRAVEYFLLLLIAVFGVWGLAGWSILLGSRVDSAARWRREAGDSDTTDSAGTAQRTATLDYPAPVPIGVIVDDFTEQTGVKVVLCGQASAMKLSLSGRNLTAGQFLSRLERASAEASRQRPSVRSRLLALLGMRKLARISAFSCGTGDALVWRRVFDGVEIWDSEAYYHPVLCVTIGIAQPNKP